MKIGRTRIKPAPAKDGGDAFTVVADATDSDTLAGPVELGELWASIPHMPRVEGLGEEFPKPIYLSARARAFDTYVTGEVTRSLRATWERCRKPTEKPRWPNSQPLTRPRSGFA
jgi:hypothetical protein